MMKMRIVLFLFLFLFLACRSSLASCSPPADASCAGATTTTTHFCGSSSCCCSAQDDLKLREAFLAEVKAHGYHNAACRSQLRAHICAAVCVSAAAPAADSALPLRCAGAAAPPPSTVVSSTRHDDELRSPSSSTLCVHRASTQAYDGVLPLHDGSGRLLCWRRNGQIWLATVDGGSVLRVGDKPVVDLGTRVSQDAAARGRGLAGVAVHSSGQLFVSYYTTAVGPDGGTTSAFLVVEQLSSSASWSEGHEHQAQLTTTRVFTMALLDESEPRRSSSGFLVDYYGGQILFRPTTTDPFLYLVTGPAQTDGQLQAKVLRLRVGGMLSENGTVTPMEAQVYASVLGGVPRRCAFDADRPHDLYCANAKEDQAVVYLNSDPSSSCSATQPSASLVVAHQRPTPGTPPSIVGGLLYRGYADNTLIGSYIFMEGSEFWWTVTSPAGNYTTTPNFRVTCAAPATATSRCRGSDDFAGGSVTSFAEDADKNAFLLAADGVYMVVQPSLCDDDDDTHTDEAPTSNKSVLKWIFGVIGSLITILGSGYGAYRTCSCFSRRNDITVNATNVSIHNGDNEIQLTVISTER